METSACAATKWKQMFARYVVAAAARRHGSVIKVVKQRLGRNARKTAAQPPRTNSHGCYVLSCHKVIRRQEETVCGNIVYIYRYYTQDFFFLFHCLKQHFLPILIENFNLSEWRFLVRQSYNLIVCLRTKNTNRNSPKQKIIMAARW